MHFQQVCMTALAFSAARGGTSLMNQQRLSIQPLRGLAEIVIEQSNQDKEEWYVSLNGNAKSVVYFPAVSTQEDLLNTLINAWEFHRKHTPPAPFLSRFVEEEATPQLRPRLLQEMSSMRQTLRDIEEQ